MIAAQAQFDTLLNLTKCNGSENVVQCLQNMSLSKLLSKAGSPKIPYGDSLDSSIWAPVVDGVELPDSPINLLRDGQCAPGARFKLSAFVCKSQSCMVCSVPMLLGSNRDEGFMFLATDPSESNDIEQPGGHSRQHGFRRRVLRHGSGGGGGGDGYGPGGGRGKPFDVNALLAWAEANFGDGAAQWGDGAARHNSTAAPLLNVGALMEIYSPVVYNRGPWYAAAAMIGDYWMACPTRRTARILAADPRRNGSVYVYRFLERPADPGVSMDGEGVCHGCEIPFVFNKLAYLASPEEKTLAATMAQYWANFAATGNPNLANPGGAAAGNRPSKANMTVNWPLFATESGDLVMHLGHGGQTGAVQVVPGLRPEQCDFWDELSYPLFPRAAWVNGTVINGINVGPK